MWGPAVNMTAGWFAMLGGALSGGTLGLFFHNENWLGGYYSFRRRLVRLGHIAFFGLGFLNILFALSANRLSALAAAEGALETASVCFVIGAVTMPLCCFLTAWRESFRRLFPIPVVCVLVGIIFLFIERFRP